MNFINNEFCENKKFKELSKMKITNEMIQDYKNYLIKEEKTVFTNVVREENADGFFKACKAVSWKFVNMEDILAGYLKNEKEQSRS